MTAGLPDRRPRQRQPRREAGTQSYGLLTVPRGGRIRLPGYRRDGRDPKVSLVVRASARKPGHIFLRSDDRPQDKKVQHHARAEDARQEADHGACGHAVGLV